MTVSSDLSSSLDALSTPDDLIAEGALQALRRRDDDAKSGGERQPTASTSFVARARRRAAALISPDQPEVAKVLSTDTSSPADVVRSLINAGRPAEASAVAASHLPHGAQDPKFLAQAKRAFSRTGSISYSVAAARMIDALEGTPQSHSYLDTVEGKLAETEPGWLPTIEGAPEKLEPSSPDTILHLLKLSVPHRQSGYTMRSRYVVDGQRAAGLDPVVLTSLGFPRTLGIEDFAATETIEGTEYRRLDLGPDFAYGQRLDAYLTAYANAAAEHVRELRPAVIHAHSGHRGFDGALVALALGRHFSIPVVYEVRGFFEATWTSDTSIAERGETFARRLRTENFCLQTAAAVVTLSETMKAEIVGRGIPASKVTVVPNGVDVEKFRPVERSSELVEKHALEGRFTFGYISNVDHPREGHELLIGAVAELNARGIPATALIVGDGKRREELEQLAQTSGTADTVVFTGKVDHSLVLDYYGLLDVFVVPRVNERAARLVTPLKPYEAMASGVPLVVSDIDALREVTGDGDRARYFATSDVSSLVAVLTELYEQPQARASLSEKARRWVETDRQWSTFGDIYREMYRSI